jgi:hexosaminidase
MEKYLNSKGKTLIGWDEILEGGLAPNAVVMSWRGIEGGIEAAKQNHYVIMTPGNPLYFDHSQSENEDSVTIGGYNPIEKVYAYEPVPSALNEEQAKYIKGAQANMWAEYMDNTAKIEYMIFPRMEALSEILWSPKENRNWALFEPRLMVAFERYKKNNINFSKAYYDLKTKVQPATGNNGITWNLESKFNNSYILYSEGDSRPVKYTQPISITKSGLYAATLYNKENRALTTLQQRFDFNLATGKKIELVQPFSSKYPGDGAFTLVNGVINEQGMSKSREFLGFSGNNCEAIIDLGSEQSIKEVVVHSLDQKESWIWRPLKAEAFGSADGKTWTSLKLTDDFIPSKNIALGSMHMNFSAARMRYVKVVVSNWGIIPDNNPGAGTKAWLFIDEIEVK